LVKKIQFDFAGCTSRCSIRQKPVWRSGSTARLNFNELPDFVIFDKNTLTGEKQDFVGGGFFNKFWELDDLSQIWRGKIKKNL
jgi:hypothetical protein